MCRRERRRMSEGKKNVKGNARERKQRERMSRETAQEKERSEKKEDEE